jgi:hypothetical protein
VKKIQKLNVLTSAVLWTIWKTHNDLCFQGVRWTDVRMRDGSARGWCEIGGAATKTRRCRRTGGLGDRVEAKKIKTNAVVLEGARRPSTRFRVQCLFQSNGSVNLMIVTQDGDVLSQSGVRGDRVGFTDGALLMLVSK